MPINWGNTPSSDHRIISRAGQPASVDDLRVGEHGTPEVRGKHNIAKSKLRHLRVVERIMSMMAALTAQDEPHGVVSYVEGFAMGLEMARRDPEAAEIMLTDLREESFRILEELHGSPRSQSAKGVEAVDHWITTILRVMGRDDSGPENEFFDGAKPSFFE